MIAKKINVLSDIKATDYITEHLQGLFPVHKVTPVTLNNFLFLQNQQA